MSTYSQVHGKVTYANKEDLMKVVKLLVKGGWILQKKDSFTFIGENDGTETEDCVDMEKLSLHIPDNFYRNLGRKVDDILDYAISGFLNEESEDGGDYIYVWKNTYDGTAHEDEIIQHLDSTEDKDLFLLDEYEYTEKHGDCLKNTSDTFYELKSYKLIEARERLESNVAMTVYEKTGDEAHKLFAKILRSPTTF